MVDIHVDAVTKRFGGFTAVDSLDIRFADGEVTCLLGPSGCGKTTLMRMVAGLETVTTGRIRFGDRDVTDRPARRRNVGMVFQYPVMYPTLSVRENILEPLRHDRSLNERERASRVEDMLELLDMRDRAGHYIEDLDAGLRQKVAVGRAVARHSDIVLFDEPTTNVEVNAKLQLIRAFKEVTARLEQTIVYVTHDQTEAMTLADRIALMERGRIVQYAPPRTLYDDPETTFGGWFLGNPGMNFVRARADGERLSAALLADPVTLDTRSDGATEPRPTQRDPEASGDGRALAHDGLWLGVRPERVRVYEERTPGCVEATLEERTIGVAGQYLLRVRVADESIAVKTGARPSVAAGSPVWLGVDRKHLLLFRDGARVH